MVNRDIATALHILAPGAIWAIAGDSLSGIEWLDTTIVRPTDDAILAQIAAQGK